MSESDSRLADALAATMTWPSRAISSALSASFSLGSVDSYIGCSPVRLPGDPGLTFLTHEAARLLRREDSDLRRIGASARPRRDHATADSSASRVVSRQ